MTASRHLCPPRLRNAALYHDVPVRGDKWHYLTTEEVSSWPALARPYRFTLGVLFTELTSLHRQLRVCHCKCAAPLSSPLILASNKGLFSISLFCSLIHRDLLHISSTEPLAGLPSCVITCVPQSTLVLRLSVELVDEPARLQLRRTENYKTVGLETTT